MHIGFPVVVRQLNAVVFLDLFKDMAKGGLNIAMSCV